MLTLFCPQKKRKPEGKAVVHMIRTASKKQENKPTKQTTKQKFNFNPREDRMSATMKNLHYIVKGTIEVCEDYDTLKRNQKQLYKVAEECNLKRGEMI